MEDYNNLSGFYNEKQSYSICIPVNFVYHTITRSKCIALVVSQLWQAASSASLAAGLYLFTNTFILQCPWTLKATWRKYCKYQTAASTESEKSRHFATRVTENRIILSARLLFWRHLCCSKRQGTSYFTSLVPNFLQNGEMYIPQLCNSDKLLARKMPIFFNICISCSKLSFHDFCVHYSSYVDRNWEYSLFNLKTLQCSANIRQVSLIAIHRLVFDIS